MPKPILYSKLARVGAPAVNVAQWNGDGLPPNWQEAQHPPVPPKRNPPLPGFAQFQIFEDQNFNQICGFIYRSNIQGFGGCFAVYAGLLGKSAPFDTHIQGTAPIAGGLTGTNIPYGPNPANHVKVFRPPGSPGSFNGNCLSSLPGAIWEAESLRIDLQYAESGISFLRNFFELRFAYPLYNDVNPSGGIGGTPTDPNIGFIVLP